MAKFKPLAATTLAGGIDLITETPNLEQEADLNDTNRRAYQNFTNDPVMVQSQYPESSIRVLNRQSTDICGSSSDDGDEEEEESAAQVYQMDTFRLGGGSKTGKKT